MWWELYICLGQTGPLCDWGLCAQTQLQFLFNSWQFLAIVHLADTGWRWQQTTKVTNEGQTGSQICCLSKDYQDQQDTQDLPDLHRDECILCKHGKSKLNPLRARGNTETHRECIMCRRICGSAFVGTGSPHECNYCCPKHMLTIDYMACWRSAIVNYWSGELLFVCQAPWKHCTPMAPQLITPVDHSQSALKAQLLASTLSNQ